MRLLLERNTKESTPQKMRDDIVLRRSFILCFNHENIDEVFLSVKTHFEILAATLPQVFSATANISYAERYDVVVDLLRVPDLFLDGLDIHEISTLDAFYEYSLQALVRHMDRLRDHMFHMFVKNT